MEGHHLSLPVLLNQPTTPNLLDLFGGLPAIRLSSSSLFFRAASVNGAFSSVLIKLNIRRLSPGARTGTP